MNWEGEQAVNPVPRMPGHLFPSLGGRGGVDPSSALSHGPSLQSTRHRKQQPGSHRRGAGRREAETGRESDPAGRQATLPRGLCTWTRERCRPLLVTTGKGMAIHKAQDRVSGRRNCIGFRQTYACGFQHHSTCNTILIKPGSYTSGQVFLNKQRHSGTIRERVISPSTALTGIIQLELPTSSSHLFCH